MNDGRDAPDNRWLFERKRAIIGSSGAFIGAAALGIAEIVKPSTRSILDSAVLVLLLYIATYLIATIAAFTRASPREIAKWAEREERGTFVQRYVLGTAPGPGVSLFFALSALIVAMIWLPGHGGRTIPDIPRACIAVTLIVLGWVSVAISYAVTFYADNVLENYQALRFPGDRNAEWSDYIYFAVSVMTTFGTTDVEVASPEMRRTVTANAVLAFVFNTVTIAATVTALSG